MMPPDRPSAARVVALEHQLALLQVHLHASRLPAGADLLGDIAHRVSALIGAKTAIAVQQSGVWAIHAESEGDVAPAIDPRSRFGELVASASREAVATT